MINVLDVISAQKYGKWMLMFEDEIDCRDLFEGNDGREKILIFQML